MYFDDGSIAQACPPLKALLHIMLHDEWEGKGLDNPEFRKLFTRESLLASDWYAARLAAKQKVDRKLWHRHVGISRQVFANAPAMRTKRNGSASRPAQIAREKPWSRSNRRRI